MNLCRIFLLISLLATALLLQAQRKDSLLGTALSISPGFINRVNIKIDRYYNRINSKTAKTLEKLSRWESRIHSILQRMNPQAALELFGNNQLTFNSLLEKFKQSIPFTGAFRQQYDEYTDKLSGSLKYLETQKSILGDKVYTTVCEASAKMEKLRTEEVYNAAIQHFIKERKQQLLERTVDYLGKSKYLRKISKESWYYAETIRNYKEIFCDEKKAEELAMKVLNEIPAFQQFMRENSMLASLFRVPGGSNNTSSLAGLQTRASVNALIQDRIAAGGPNTQAAIAQNIQLAQAQLQQLKDKVIKAGGGNSNADIPNFKPNIQKTKTFLQRMEFGSNLQFAKPNGNLPTTADIALSVGYKPNEKSVIGLGASYKMGLGSIQRLSISHQGIGLRSFVDWKAPFGSPNGGKQMSSFYITGGFEMNYNAQFHNINVLKSYQSWQRAGLIGLSKKINIKTKWFKGSKIQLLYDLLAREHVPVSQPVLFRVGYQFQ